MTTTLTKSKQLLYLGYQNRNENPKINTEVWI